MRRLLVTAIVAHSTTILVTLMMEALSSSESSIVTRANVVPSSPILVTLMQEALGSSETLILT
jgi:hypothetical protein